VLNEIMVEASFKGSVDGTRIGNAADDVVTRRGSLTPSRRPMAAQAISIAPAATS